MSHWYWLLFFVGFIINSSSVYAGRYEGCSIGLTYPNNTMPLFMLNTFDHNCPKSGEIVRTKVYFKQEEPVLQIKQLNMAIIFGKVFLFRIY